MSADRVSKSMWFPFYWNDYLNDTRGLTFTQHGGYVMCMAAYYSSEKPLPGDLPTLYRSVGAFTEDEQAAVRFIVDRFFKLEDGVYRQKRIDTELGRIVEKKSQAQAAVNTRWSNTAKEAARKLDQPNYSNLEDALVNATTRYTMANPQQDPEKIVEAMSVAVWTLRQQGLPDEKIINGLEWLMHQQNKDLAIPEEPVEQA